MEWEAEEWLFHLKVSNETPRFLASTAAHLVSPLKWNKLMARKARMCGEEGFWPCWASGSWRKFGGKFKQLEMNVCVFQERSGWSDSAGLSLMPLSSKLLVVKLCASSVFTGACRPSAHRAWDRQCRSSTSKYLPRIFKICKEVLLVSQDLAG